MTKPYDHTSDSLEDSLGVESGQLRDKVVRAVIGKDTYSRMIESIEEILTKRELAFFAFHALEEVLKEVKQTSIRVKLESFINNLPTDGSVDVEEELGKYMDERGIKGDVNIMQVGRR